MNIDSSVVSPNGICRRIGRPACGARFLAIEFDPIFAPAFLGSAYEHSASSPAHRSQTEPMLKPLGNVIATLLAVLPGSGSVGLERVGDVLQFAVPASAGAAAIAMRDWAGVRQFALVMIVSQGATHLIKHTLNTERPDGGQNGFPSAHTSSAFAGAGFASFRYGNRYAWPLHVLAALTGYSRMTANKHHFVDVFGGAALSLLCSWPLVRRKARAAGVDELLKRKRASG